MKNFLLRNLALSVLFAGAMQAAPLLWDFSTGPTGGLFGNTETFTNGGFTITAKGYASNGTLTNLFGKADGNNENGLGLNAFSDHEITAGNDFIQLDLSALVGVTNFQIRMNSSTTGACNASDNNNCTEGWLVYNCPTSGTACSGGTTLRVSGNDQGFHSFTLNGPLASNSFLDIKASSGNVLLYQLSADSPTVPEPSTISFMLLSGILLCGVSFFKAKRA